MWLAYGIWFLGWLSFLRHCGGPKCDRMLATISFKKSFSTCLKENLKLWVKQMKRCFSLDGTWIMAGQTTVLNTAGYRGCNYYWVRGRNTHTVCSLISACHIKIIPPPTENVIMYKQGLVQTWFIHNSRWKPRKRTETRTRNEDSMINVCPGLCFSCHNSNHQFLRVITTHMSENRQRFNSCSGYSLTQTHRVRTQSGGFVSSWWLQESLRIVEITSYSKQR